MSAHDSAPAPCPHEVRPGTTVCLHCRREARATSLKRLRQTLLGVVCAVVVIAAAVAVGMPYFNAAPRTPSSGELHAAPTSEARETPAAATIAPTPPPPAPTLTNAAQPAESGATVAAPPLTPRIAAGRTVLEDGVVALRQGDSITVSFDLPAVRTRRRDKFERVVRATLPQVYGAAAESALARVPAGALVPAGELPAELTNRGLHLPLADGWTLVLRPQTRAAADGPLVIGYGATVAR